LTELEFKLDRIVLAGMWLRHGIVTRRKCTSLF